MYVIVCLDDRGGMLFNHRRQSRDRVVQEKILTLCAGKKLWMNHGSAQLFPENVSEINVDDRFLQEAGPGDFCFVETEALLPWEKWIEGLYVFRWNRVYPADVSLDLPLENWHLHTAEEFPGFSHEKITLEVYEQ